MNAKIKKLKKGESALIISPPEKLQENIFEAIEYFVKEKNKNCLYITLNKPAITLKKELITRKLNEKKFYFIDCITAKVSKTKEEKNVLFVPEPSDLTAIGLAIKEFSQIVEEEGIIVIDALRTLLIYNKATDTERFITSLLKGEKELRLNTILFSTEIDLGVINKLKAAFNKKINLKKWY